MIAGEVNPWLRYEGCRAGDEIGKPLTHRPWLELLPTGSSKCSDKYGCSIYQDRPEDCRQYPAYIAEMVRDGCDMIEVRELDSPDRAQKALEKIMSDSRPPA